MLESRDAAAKLADASRYDLFIKGNAVAMAVASGEPVAHIAARVTRDGSPLKLGRKPGVKTWGEGN